MPAKRDDTKADGMIALYEVGFSLSQIAVAFDVSRQAVFKMLKRRKVKFRSIEPLPFIMWRGQKYTLRTTGYYARTDCERQFLHRDVWEAHNGPIPPGYEIHHRDENKQHNAIENLQMLTASEHGKLHGFRRG